MLDSTVHSFAFLHLPQLHQPELATRCKPNVAHTLNRLPVLVNLALLPPECLSIVRRSSCRAGQGQRWKYEQEEGLSGPQLENHL